MSLRFAILKTVGSEESQVVLEYDQKILLDRLCIRIREQLIATEKLWKHRWAKEEIDEAVKQSFTDLTREFKEQTVKIL